MSWRNSLKSGAWITPARYHSRNTTASTRIPASHAVRPEHLLIGGFNPAPFLLHTSIHYIVDAQCRQPKVCGAQYSRNHPHREEGIPRRRAGRPTPNALLRQYAPVQNAQALPETACTPTWKEHPGVQSHSRCRPQPVPEPFRISPVARNAP